MAIADSATPVRGVVIAPHLGALMVEHDRGLGLGASRWPLHEVRVGSSIEATATIVAVKAFQGRTRLVLDDGHGGSANVLIDTAKVMTAFRSAGFPPRPGTRVVVRGDVERSLNPHVARGISARSIRVVA